MNTRTGRRWRLALLICVSACNAPRAQAQSLPDTSGPLASAEGAFMALSVPDLEASAAWYEAKLGLRRVMTVPRTGQIAGVIALEGPGILVELIQHDAARPGTPTPELTHGIAKAGVLVRDFDGAVARLRSRGVTFFGGPYPARPGVRANVMFRDNAGNVIQLLGPAESR